MSTPTFYPPLQPGALDSCVPYTFVLLARGASVFTTGENVGGMGRGAGWANNDGTWLQAVDSVGSITSAPGDIAMRCQVLDTNVWDSGPQTISFNFIAEDNAGNSVVGTQTFVVRGWTCAGSFNTGADTVNAGLPLSFTTGGSVAQETVTFGLTSHGFAVGDRLYIGAVQNPAVTTVSMGPSPQTGFWIVTGVPDADQFTASGAGLLSEGVTTGGILYTGADSSGRQAALAYLCAYQTGRTQNDITSAAMISGTWGVAIAPYTITTDGAGTPYAQGVPDGIGLASGVLSGTPVTYRWYPATLIEGTMQRLCLFDIAPGTYQETLIAPSTVNVTAGLSALAIVTAPNLTGTTISWYLSNAPSGITIASNGATMATVSGSIAANGSYPVVVTATASNGVIVSKTIAFVVTGAVPTYENNPLWIPWLHSDLTLLDLQFDLRGRGVASFYAQNGAIPLIESDGCKLAIVLFGPGQVSDATTIWFTARRDIDTRPVIDQQATGTSALTTVTGGSYYLMTVNLSADAIVDALNDLDDPGDGTSPALTLHAQLAVLRSGVTARSQPFVITITQRIADAGLGPLNEY